MACHMTTKNQKNMNFSIRTLVLLAFMASANLLNAQSIQILNPVNIATAPTAQDYIEISLGIKNISSTAKNIKVEKTTIFNVPGTDNNICWGTNCYPPFVDDTPNAENIAAGGVNYTFKGDYHHNGLYGNTQVKYCFYVDGNKSDSTCILIDYHAYEISNASFENWNNQTGTETPNNWVTSNSLIAIGATTETSVFKESDSQSGFAASIKTVELDNNPNPGFLANAVGFMMYGNLNPLTEEFSGLSFVGMPASIEFYSKYQPVGLDTFSISARLTRWNTVTSARETIAEGFFSSSAAEADYSLKALNFNYVVSELPDSLMIFINSSSSFSPNAGSQLFIDELFATEAVVFVNVPTIISNLPSVKVFPNPAKDWLQISSGADFSKVEIYDINGRLVKSNFNTGKEFKMDVSSMSPGFYIYSIISNDNRSTGRFTVIR
jgi:hypothetical protein